MRTDFAIFEGKSTHSWTGEKRCGERTRAESANRSPSALEVAKRRHTVGKYDGHLVGQEDDFAYMRPSFSRQTK